MKQSILLIGWLMFGHQLGSTSLYGQQAMGGNSTNSSLVPNLSTSAGDTPPTAICASTTRNGLAPFVVGFDASGSRDDDGVIVSYLWDFGDGQIAREMITRHVYAAPGTYKLTLTVTDDTGLSSVDTTTIRVKSRALPRLPICGDQDGSETPLIFNCGDLVSVGNVQFFQIPGTTPADVSFDFVFREADFNNELAVFRVDDPTGSIGGLLPGQPGYLAAAFDRAQIIFPSGSTAFTPDVTLSFNGGDILVFFIIQNNTLANLRLNNPNNDLSRLPLAFFSLDLLNPDGIDHFMGFENVVTNQTQFGFEDITNGGDLDFDDIVYNIGIALLPLQSLTTTKTANSPTSSPGATNGYALTVSNANAAIVTLDAVIDTLPAGFSYSPGSSSGLTTADPLISGQALRWNGPFSVPASGSVSLNFSVNVSLITGEYFNNATATAGGLEVTPTGNTARIAVIEPLVCNVTIATPSDSTVLCADSIEVCIFTQVNGGAGPITKTCEVNGIMIDGFCANVPLGIGVNNIVAVCTFTDSLGQSVTCSDSVIVIGCSLPTCTVEIISPVSGAQFCNGNVQVTAVARALGGLPPLTKAGDINGIPAAISGDTLRATVPLQSGSNTIKAACTFTDALGNTTACVDSVQVSAAGLACAVEIQKPAEGAVICEGSAIVRGLMTATGGVGPLTQTCTINGRPAFIRGNEFSGTAVLSSGTNNIIVVCAFTDSLGCSTTCSDTVRVLRDDRPPQCEFTATATVASGTISDHESGIATIRPEFLHNSRLIVDPFTPGAKVVRFRVEIIDPEDYFSFGLNLTDQCGNFFYCDPVLLSVLADRPYEITFPAADRYLQLTNTGLSEIQVNLNGYEFKLVADAHRARREINSYFVPAEGSITLDLKPYLKEGENRLRMAATGPPGAQARLLLIDIASQVDYILDLQPLPLDYALLQNYPNPFNPTTYLRYAIPADLSNGVRVRLLIYNALGNLVKTLVDEEQRPGHYVMEWDGRDDAGRPVSSGIYIYRFTAGEFKATRRMILLR